MVSQAEMQPEAEEYQRLCLHVGHLFLMFARLEGALSSLLRLHLSHRISGPKKGTPTKHEGVRIAAAVYGSMRFQSARDTLKRLMDIQKLDLDHRAGVDAVFIQIGHIQSFRDAIAHQQTFKAYTDKPDVWYLTDIATTRAAVNAKAQVFHLAAIAHATTDLNAATHLFGGETVRRHIISKPERFLELPTWRYKPSMLVQTPHSSLLLPQAP